MWPISYPCRTARLESLLINDADMEKTQSQVQISKHGRQVGDADRGSRREQKSTYLHLSRLVIAGVL